MEIVSSTNRPMTALKGKLLKVVLLLVNLFVVCACLLVFKTGSHYIAGLKLTAT